MIWGLFVTYVLASVCEGAYRAGERAAKIVKGAYGRARQAASRMRTSSPVIKVGTDPAAEGAVALVAHPPGAGKGITDQSRAIMQRLGINADEALERAAAGAETVRRLLADQAMTGAGLAAYLGQNETLRGARPIPITLEEADMIESPERPSAGLSGARGYQPPTQGLEGAETSAEGREEACVPEPDVPGGYGVDLLGVDSGEREHVITEHDPAFNDLQTYLEGGPVESVEAAKRLDQRGVDYGQISPKTFWDTWGEEPRRSDLPHKIWCARWHQHPVSECPVWGAE